MERSEVIELLIDDSSIGDLLEDEEVEDACNDAASDTGWSFPVSGSFQEKWIKHRARRHCFFKLYTQSARKFKVEQLSLNQRFDHYGKVIDRMDDEFRQAQEDNPEQFAGTEAYKMFGTVTGPGFVYDDLGRDRTYE